MVLGTRISVAYGFLQPGRSSALSFNSSFSHFYAVDITLGLSCNRGRWHEINRPFIHFAWSSFHLWPNVNYCCVARVGVAIAWRHGGRLMPALDYVAISPLW